jgi:hypothetical protein
VPAAAQKSTPLAGEQTRTVFTNPSVQEIAVSANYIPMTFAVVRIQARINGSRCGAGGHQRQVRATLRIIGLITRRSHIQILCHRFSEPQFGI